MTRLMRASEVLKRPVVTVAGEDVAQVKDVVYAAEGGAVSGFTLAGRGRFAGPLRHALSWSSVMALGPAAVMIRDPVVLEPTAAVLDRSAASGGADGDVLGAQVLTDAGTGLGIVVDVILEVADSARGQCNVVGYEIEASEALGTNGVRVFIPMHGTLAASGKHLMVPATVTDFVAHDLADFGASVQAFRHAPEGRR